MLKQTFAIPGSTMLNVMVGATVGLWRGLPLVIVLMTAGSCCCYLLSAYLGGPFMSLLAHRAAPLRARIARAQRDGTLITTLLSVRTFPLTPHWLLNMTAPWLGVPFAHFSLTICLGLIPYNFVTVQAGTLVAHLTGDEPIISWTTAAQLALLSVAAQSPHLVKYLLARSAGSHTAPAKARAD